MFAAARLRARLVPFLARRPAPRLPRHAVPRLDELEPRVVPTFMGNQLFPSDNPWNQQITNAPVAANSATLVNSIGFNRPVHADFGTVYQGSSLRIPVNVVSAGHPLVNGV